jgi:hypothetical protein
VQARRSRQPRPAMYPAPLRAWRPGLSAASTVSVVVGFSFHLAHQLQVFFPVKHHPHPSRLRVQHIAPSRPTRPWSNVANPC